MTTTGQPRRIEYVPVDDLRPHPDNPKMHDADGLAASIARFGYVEPQVVDERTGFLIAGHGRLERLLAQRDAGDPAPDGVVVREDGVWLVPVVRGWASKDDDEALAYLVASNQTSIAGGWNTDVLTDLLVELAEGPGLDGIGFTPEDVDDLVAEAIQFDSEAPRGAAGRDTSYDERAEGYRNKQVRSMVMDFPIDAYEFVVETAARARQHFRVASNAELFARLVEEASR